MSLTAFCEEPWKVSHPSYEESVFNIRPAPEFSTAEVVVASLYRACGFPDYKENDVPKSGREFDRMKFKARDRGKDTVRPDTWRSILHGVLESPKQPNQSSKRFLQLCPVVPDCALYSGSARLAGNSWNPGALIARMIQLGSASREAAESLWVQLFDALSISGNDDVWARWLQEEFGRLRTVKAEWKRGSLDEGISLPEEEVSALRYPAKQLVRDLDAVIEAKESMTRRQWISLLEAILRVGVVTHVLWLCRVNDRLWKVISSVLGQGQAFIPSTENEFRDQIISAETNYLSYGTPAVPTIRDYASGYLVARLGLNLVLWLLSEQKIEPNRMNSVQSLFKFVDLVKEHREGLLANDALGRFHKVLDGEARTIACKKGIGSNLVEFGRHTLGQRQASDDTLRGYDQSYFLRKRGEAKSSPYVLSLGPVAVLAVVHCCLREFNGPRSIQRLSSHLASYGIEVDVDDINSSDLGRSLRMLGLVLDSPDAETGMLLVPPFVSTRQKVEQ